MIHHATTLQSVCVAESTETRRGIMNVTDVAVKKHWAATTLTHKSHLAWLMRRRVSKLETGNIADLELPQRGSTVSEDVYQEHKHQPHGRRYASAMGVQRCSKIIFHVMCHCISTASW